MKVILETADLIRIIGAHFGSEFDTENVTIRTDPFEVEVRGIPLPTGEKAPSAPPRTTPPPRMTLVDDPEPFAPDADDAERVARRADDNASVDPPPPGMDESEAMDVNGSPMALIEQSRRLQAELDQNRPAPQRKGGSSRAPTDFHDEVT